MESLGRVQRKVASSLQLPKEHLLRLRGHALSVTAVAVTPSGKTVYTGSKDGSIIKWDLQSGKRQHTFHRASKKDKDSGHTSHILALAISSDGQYLASGAADKTIRIWSIAEDKPLGRFIQHKDQVTVSSSLRFLFILLWGIEGSEWPFLP